MLHDLGYCRSSAVASRKYFLWAAFLKNTCHQPAWHKRVATKFTFDLCLCSNFITAKTVQNHLVYCWRGKYNQQKPRSVCERNCKMQGLNKRNKAQVSADEITTNCYHLTQLWWHILIGLSQFVDHWNVLKNHIFCG